ARIKIGEGRGDERGKLRRRPSGRSRAGRGKLGDAVEDVAGLPRRAGEGDGAALERTPVDEEVIRIARARIGVAERAGGVKQIEAIASDAQDVAVAARAPDTDDRSVVPTVDDHRAIR